MRKFAVRLLMTLCLLALFVFGVDWVMQTGLRSWIPGGPEQWPGLAYVPVPLHTGIGLAALLLPILAGAAYTLLGRGDHIEARSREGDLIRLTPAAIERVVRRDVISKVEEVTKAGVAACQGRARTAAVTVSVAVSDRSPVPAVEREVRRVTAESLEQLFGTADSSNIRVVVFDVQSGRVRKKAPKAPKPEKPEAAIKPRKVENSASPRKPLQAPASLPAAPTRQEKNEKPDLFGTGLDKAPSGSPKVGDLPQGGALDSLSEDLDKKA